MKKIFFMTTCLMALIFMIVLPLRAKAQVKDFSESVYIQEGQTIEDNFVRVANTFDIRGNIKGDVIVAGTSVDISGKVEGDVLVAAATVKISGEVEGNVRAAGGTITIEGKVGKNVNLFFATVDFGQNSEVEGDTAVWAGTANFKGISLGKIDGGAGSITIAGTVKKDVNLRFDTQEKSEGKIPLTILSSAVIEGNVDYNSYNEAQIEQGADIGGRVTRHEPVGIFKEASKFLNSFWWFTKIAGLFGLFVVGLIVVSIFKKESREVSEIMLKNSGRSILWGLIILFLVPLICLFLLITIIGAPLAIITLLIYGLAIYVSKVFIGLTTGRKILEYFRNKKTLEARAKKDVSLFWSMILGILIYSLVTDFLLGFSWQGAGLALGLLESLIKLFAIVWALGALFMMKKQRMGESSK